MDCNEDHQPIVYHHNNIMYTEYLLCKSTGGGPLCCDPHSRRHIESCSAKVNSRHTHVVMMKKPMIYFFVWGVASCEWRVTSVLNVPPMSSLRKFYVFVLAKPLFWHALVFCFRYSYFLLHSSKSITFVLAWMCGLYITCTSTFHSNISFIVSVFHNHESASV